MIAIAIDGPAGAGKSTISRRVAKELGFIYVDTGALYRAVGLKALRSGIAAEASGAFLDMLKRTKVDLIYQDGEQCVLLDGDDVSGEIRTPKASRMASAVSALPAVRSFLLDMQRELARTHDVVMDGRDIGTVVLPRAKVKIFLTASPEERAMRRYQELLGKGIDTTYEAVLADIKTREYNDSHRAVAPLKPAPDAVVVDTTGNTLEQSVAQLLKVVKDRL